MIFIPVGSVTITPIGFLMFDLYCSTNRVTPQLSVSSPAVAAKITRPLNCCLLRSTIACAAAQSPPSISTAPRPKILPSCSTGQKGSVSQCSFVAGTTSRCAPNSRVGALASSLPTDAMTLARFPSQWSSFAGISLCLKKSARASAAFNSPLSKVGADRMSCLSSSFIVDLQCPESVSVIVVDSFTKSETADSTDLSRI